MVSPSTTSSEGHFRQLVKEHVSNEWSYSLALDAINKRFTPQQLNYFWNTREGIQWGRLADVTSGPYADWLPLRIKADKWRAARDTSFHTLTEVLRTKSEPSMPTVYEEAFRSAGPRPTKHNRNRFISNTTWRHLIAVDQVQTTMTDEMRRAPGNLQELWRQTLVRFDDQSKTLQQAIVNNEINERNRNSPQSDFLGGVLHIAGAAASLAWGISKDL